jgi:DNA-binding MarR family transcriptional regulator
MTDTITPALNPDANISPICAVILNTMLARPRSPYFCDGLAKVLDANRSSLRYLLRNLENAGWLVSEMEPRGRYQQRRYYRFTPEGVKLARAEVKKWDFKDAQ